MVPLRSYLVAPVLDRFYDCRTGWKSFGASLEHLHISISPQSIIHEWSEKRHHRTNHNPPHTYIAGAPPTIPPVHIYGSSYPSSDSYVVWRARQKFVLTAERSLWRGIRRIWTKARIILESSLELSLRRSTDRAESSALYIIHDLIIHGIFLRITEIFPEVCFPCSFPHLQISVLKVEV